MSTCPVDRRERVETRSCTVTDASPTVPIDLGGLPPGTHAELRRLCRRLGSPSHADDLVQETYLRALESAGTYRGTGAARGWLLAIARNVCADHVRARQRDRRIQNTLETLHDREPPRAMTGTVVLTDLLGSLDPERRDAFFLTQLAGLEYQDVARWHECPVGTVRSRVARARCQLREVVASEVPAHIGSA
ncbi:MAG: RNA polymerase sigma factor [Thermoleophilia bacterium]